MFLDELQALLTSMTDAAEQFSDDTSEWLLVAHRLESIKEKFQFLFAKTNREHRELKVDRLTSAATAGTACVLFLDGSRAN